jgi:hypothetical protein
MTMVRTRSDAAAAEELAQAIEGQLVQIGQRQKQMLTMRPNFELPSAQVRHAEIRQQPVEPIQILE